MKQEEIVYTANHKVSCSGGDVENGHPLVYLEIKNKEVQCPYCSKIFRLNKNEDH